TSTADPLLDSHIDSEAEPEPRKVEEKVPLAKVDFLKHFGNEIALQETSTADPLLDSHIDSEAEPEPRKVEEKVPLAKV
ncbi:hypothetical protein C7E12_22100, partial [Stenotrophomonas maltophilia]